MTHDRHLLPKITLITLVGVPLCVMSILTITVLLPTLKDPNSNIYGSPIGYPSLKRLLKQPIKVQTVAAERKSWQESLAAPGESVALQDVSISPLIEGTVEKVFVAEGDIVRKGQPLLRINQVPFQDNVETARANLAIAESELRQTQESEPATLIQLEADLKSAKARLDIAKAQFEQLQSLLDEGVISRTLVYARQDEYVQRQQEFVFAQQELARHQSESVADLETAKFEVDSNQVALQQALRDLDNTVIYAPSDGLISQVNIHSGETATANNSFITLTQNIVFKAYVDQARLDSINVGDTATVRLVSFSGQNFDGKVIRLNPTVETDVPRAGAVGADRQYTYSVWIQVDGLEMPPGVQGYAQFEQDEEKLVVPERSVTHLSAGEGMVMVVEAGQAVVKRVKLGKVFDGQREVLAGLDVGEQIVLSPRALNPGDQLKAEFATLPTDNP